MLLVLVAGLILFAIGTALALDVRDSGSFVIKRVTSRSLGSLAPGFAASPAGFRVYALLIAAIGAVLMGLGSLDQFGSASTALAVVGVVAFVLLSIAAIAGEVKTFRDLKR